MKLEYDWDGLPLCPICGGGLDYDSPKGRETETMGGSSIQYYCCGKCGEKYELIDGWGGKKLVYAT